ncbi:hypothetical protein Tco_0597070 [Tanacetum coccineum]
MYNLLTSHSEIVDIERWQSAPASDHKNQNALIEFDTSAGNHVNEILLKLNLPDHRSILMDSKVTPTKHGRNQDGFTVKNDDMKRSQRQRKKG